MPVKRYYVYDPAAEAQHIAHRFSIEDQAVVMCNTKLRDNLSGIVAQTSRDPRESDIVIFSADSEADYAMELRAHDIRVVGGSTFLSELLPEHFAEKLDTNYGELAKDLYRTTVGWFSEGEWRSWFTESLCCSRMLSGGYGPEVIDAPWATTRYCKEMPSALEHLIMKLVEPLRQEEYEGPVVMMWNYDDDGYIHVEQINSDWSHISLVTTVLLTNSNLADLAESGIADNLYNMYSAGARISVPMSMYPVPFNIMVEDANWYWLSGVEFDGRTKKTAPATEIVGIATALSDEYGVVGELKRRIDRLQLPDKMWRNDVKVEDYCYPQATAIGYTSI